VDSLGSTAIEKLKNAIGATMETKWGVYYLHFDNHIGKGTIEVLNFDRGLGCMHWKAIFYKETCISMSFVSVSPLEFIYLVDGSLHFNRGKRNSQTVRSRQNLIVSYKTHEEYCYAFPQDEYIELHVIQILPNLKFGISLNKVMCIDQEVKKRFLENKVPLFVHFGSIDLFILEKIKEKNACCLEGNLYGIYMEGITMEILSLQLSEYEKFHYRQKLPQNLNAQDIEKIRAVYDYIESNLHKSIVIRDLVYHSGLESKKIQSAFKHFYDKTVNSYITEKRMKLAVQLLEKNEYSISQICDMIGYESKSYFSKKFQEYYAIKPSKYVLAKKTGS